ncbi:MAG: Smr/MutS family protein [Alphaproteobacteria bacterium]|nr:Smr/MutS family protein [Alphaproteobacteria bacterium]
MRKASDSERKEFERDFKLARPIKPKAAPRATKKSGGSGGLDGNTQDRLDRGLIAPDATLDLHGMTQERAHRTLSRFLTNAQQMGSRLIVVVTGKGNPRPADAAAWTQSPHGVLKEMVPRWLAEPELKRLIARTQPAHIRHGGGGALYVYLRKSK